METWDMLWKSCWCQHSGLKCPHVESILPQDSSTIEKGKNEGVIQGFFEVYCLVGSLLRELYEVSILLDRRWRLLEPERQHTSVNDNGGPPDSHEEFDWARQESCGRLHEEIGFGPCVVDESRPRIRKSNWFNMTTAYI